MRGRNEVGDGGDQPWLSAELAFQEMVLQKVVTNCP